MSVSRNAFKLFVTIDSALVPTSDIMESHKGYPIDNVIQIKLDQNGFKQLFRDEDMTTSTGSRYQAAGLLERFEKFFERNGDQKYNNYNNLASDITTLINNTYNDIDVNPVALEGACAKDGAIFNYFIKSGTQHRHNPASDEEYGSSEVLTSSGEMANEYGGGNPLKVYEVIAREIDNMISRNVDTDNQNLSTSDLEYNYSDLDALYTIAEEAFWSEENMKVGDSIFIEGSFNVPTANPKSDWKQNDVEGGSGDDYEVVGEDQGANLPIILQFVHSSVETYEFDG